MTNLQLPSVCIILLGTIASGKTYHFNLLRQKLDSLSKESLNIALPCYYVSENVENDYFNLFLSNPTNFDNTYKFQKFLLADFASKFEARVGLTLLDSFQPFIGKQYCKIHLDSGYLNNSLYSELISLYDSLLIDSTTKLSTFDKVYIFHFISTKTKSLTRLLKRSPKEYEFYKHNSHIEYMFISNYSCVDYLQNSLNNVKLFTIGNSIETDEQITNKFKLHVTNDILYPNFRIRTNF
jgi:hypothetical protein